MSKRILIDDSPEVGMRQWATFDDGDGPNSTGVTIETESTNIREALDANAAARSVNTSINRGTQTMGHHVASIPTGVYEQFCRENPELRQNTKDAQAWLMARLNDRDYCHLKTYSGRA